MKKLYIILVIIGISQLSISQGFVFMGQLNNNNGNLVIVNISADDGQSVQHYTSITDASGFFMLSLGSNIPDTSTLSINILNCYNDTISYDTLFYNDSISGRFFVFPDLDYCPSCNAYFLVDQAYINNGATPVPGTLVVTDSSAGTALTYNWDFGDMSTGTGTQLTHSYSGNGPYILCLSISDTVGCSDSYCDTLSVDSLGMIIETNGFNLIIGTHSLNISKNHLGNSINVFPNPVKTKVTIEYNALVIQNNSINIYDLAGKKVRSTTFLSRLGQNQVVLSTDGIEAGIYVIELNSIKNSFTKKIIIE